MDDTAKQICFGLVAPLLIAGAALGPAWRPAESGRDRRAWRIPVALGVPVVLAFVMLYGPVTEKWQATVYVAAVGTAAGVAMAISPRAVLVRGLLLAALAAGTTVAVWPVFAEGDPRWIRVVPAAGTLLLAAALEPLAVRRPGASVPGALTIAAGATAAIVLNSGFLKLTAPIGALTVALGVSAALALFRRRLSLADGAVAVVAPLLVVAPLVAWLYAAGSGASIPAVSYALPAASPLLLWAGELPVVRDRPAPVAVAVRWLLVFGVCAVAIVLAFGVFAEAAPTDDLDAMYREMTGGG